MTTYSLDAVAAELGLTDAMADPVRWLTRQIATGRIRARKIGRQWRMTRADIDGALEVWANTTAPAPAAPKPIPARRGSSVSTLRRRAAANWAATS